MKKRLLSLSFVVVTLVATLSSLVISSPLGSVAYADNITDAKAYCTTAEKGKLGDPLVESCYNGFLQSRKVEAKKSNETKDHYCKTTPAIDYSACAGGWDAAIKKTTPATPDSELAGQISEKCSSYKGDKYDSCAQGFTGAKKNKSQSASCSGAKDQNVCKNTWASAKNTLDPDKVDQPAQDACKSHKSNPDEYKACVIGYQSGLNGGTTDADCTPFSGAAKTACQGGFGAGQAAAGGAAEEQLDCDAQYNNPLSWIICPIVDTLASLIDGLDHIITQYMEVDTDSIFSDSSDTSSAYHSAWQQFRNIALGLMIVVGLVIVISQALGLEILDAYTIRKTLPRLLIAAIGITLSWPIMHFMIEASNWLGFGIRRLIYYPFTQGGLKTTIDLSFGGGIGNILGGTGAVVGGAGLAVPIWIALGGAGVLLSYAATGALAVLIAILVLVIRQIAIIFLMLLAPMAIIAYALPNTQKFYKLWWESFSKALLMFPLIAGFIAVGRVFAAVSFSNPGPISQLIGFISYVAPYFLIPLTFKFAGGFVRQLGGFVNDRGRGAFDGLRNYRGNQRKSRVERARAAGLYRKKDGIPGLLNKIGFYTLNADEQIPYDLGSGTGLGRGPLGRLGKPLFGRMAAEMAGQKAGAAAEHTAKGVEQANLHYSAAWGALGLRSRLAGGMTEEGRAAMDEKYGVDADGKRTKDRSKIVRWKAPDNADFAGLQEYATLLAEGGTDGSDAQMGGSELLAKAGVLSSFGLHMETQRATLSSVAAASAAKDGKLNTDEVIGVHQRAIEGATDPAQIAIANSLLTQIEGAATNHNPSLRRGKGIRQKADGSLYSVYQEPASAEAFASVLSLKGQASGAAKADHIDEMAPTILEIIGGQHVENFGGDSAAAASAAKAQRDAVIYGAENPYGDADSRVRWEKIATQIGASSEERAAARIQAEEDRKNSAGQPPPEAPPSFGPSGLPGAGAL